MNLQNIGKKGEEAAADYLRSKKYKILTVNYKIRYGEIDIVALYQNVVVFVEVKTRTTFQFGHPAESITFWKMRSLIKTAKFYMISHPKFPYSFRIDAVSVIVDINGNVNHIEHIENITS